MVLDEDKHYFRFDDDEEWCELVSARLVSRMRRQRLIADGDYFSVTRLGLEFLRQHAP